MRKQYNTYYALGLFDPEQIQTPLTEALVSVTPDDVKLEAVDPEFPESEGW